VFHQLAAVVGSLGDDSGFPACERKAGDLEGPDVMKPKPEQTDAAIIEPAPRVHAPQSGGHLVEQVIVRRSRLIDKDVAAQYFSTSVDTIERLIQTGALPVVKLPVEHSRNTRSRTGVSRRVLIDVRDLDALIERSKETAWSGQPTRVVPRNGVK
jgi:hypothetical protein